MPNKQRDHDDIPQFIPEKDEIKARGSRRAGGANIGIGSGLVIFITVVIALSGTTMAYLAWKELGFSQRVFQEQQERMAELEQNDRVRSEDVLSLGGRVDGGLDRIGLKLDSLRVEVGENRKTLGQASASLPAFQQAFVSYKATLDSYQQITAKQRSDLELLKGQLNALLEEVRGSGLQMEALRETVNTGGNLRQELEGLRQSLQEMGGKIGGVNQSVSFYERRIKANEEWLESINEWRRELNARLLRMQELVESLGKGEEEEESESGFETVPL